MQNRGWRERWFVLQGDRLYYYKTAETKQHIAYISLGMLVSFLPIPAIFCLLLDDHYCHHTDVCSRVSTPDISKSS